MTAQDIARLRELHAALVPGEWSVRPDTHLVVRGPWIVVSVSLSSDDESQATATYIAAAHNALPAVLTALEQARAERDAALAELAAVRAQLHNQPSDYENTEAEERIRQIDRLFAHYGNDQHKWPQHAQDAFARLDTAQRAYEAKYC